MAMARAARPLGHACRPKTLAATRAHLRAPEPVSLTDPDPAARATPQLVREATCNDPREPQTMLLKEIAKGTFTVDFSAIMCARRRARPTAARWPLRVVAQRIICAIAWGACVCVVVTGRFRLRGGGHACGRAIVWKRIKDKSTPHHAYKCLTLLEYLLREGNSELVHMQVGEAPRPPPIHAPCAPPIHAPAYRPFTPLDDLTRLSHPSPRDRS